MTFMDELHELSVLQLAALERKCERENKTQGQMPSIWCLRPNSDLPRTLRSLHERNGNLSRVTSGAALGS